MNCINIDNIFDDFSFDTKENIDSLGDNYIEILKKNPSGFYIKECFKRNQLLKYIVSDDLLDQLTLWGNGTLQQRFKQVGRNPLSGYFITEESIKFLYMTKYKTYLLTECESVPIGSYFGVSTIHGTYEKVCRLTPVIEQDEKTDSNSIIEVKINDTVKKYRSAFIKVDDFNLNGNIGTYIGEYDEETNTDKDFGYFSKNEQNNLYNTSFPSIQVLYKKNIPVAIKNFFIIEIKENVQHIEFTYKDITARSSIKTENQMLKIEHNINNIRYYLELPNYIQKSETNYITYNSYYKIQLLKIQMISLLYSLHPDIDMFKYCDYIFYGINIKTFIIEFIILFKELKNTTVIKKLFLDDSMSDILEKFYDNYELVKINLMTEFINNETEFDIYFDHIKNIENVVEFKDSNSTTLLMYVLYNYNHEKYPWIFSFIDKYINNGGDINSLSKNNESVLSLCLENIKNLNSNEKDQLHELFKYILEYYRADPNISNNIDSLLHIAIYYQLYEEIVLLEKYGADINVKCVQFDDNRKCNKYMTPIEYNLYLKNERQEEINTKIHNFLISKGSKEPISIKDIECIKNEEEEEIYIEEEEEIDIRPRRISFTEEQEEENEEEIDIRPRRISFTEDEEEENEEEIDIRPRRISFTEEEENKNEENLINDIFLNLKSNEIDFDILFDGINTILALDYNPHVIDNEGNTIGHLIIKNDNINNEDKKQLLNLLIEYSYYINTEDNLGNTILQYAVFKNNEELTDFLLENGADKEYITNNDFSDFYEMEITDIAKLNPNYINTNIISILTR